MLWKVLPTNLMLLAMILCVSSLLALLGDSLILIEVDLFMINGSMVSMPLLVDFTGTTFSLTVLLISMSVMLFSKNYMMGDDNINRFTWLVFLFVLSMNFLIFIPHLGFLLLGWDGLGITSFVLVIYYLNSKSLGAGMITAITNRIGDVLILISLALLYDSMQWNIINMWENKSMLYVVMLLLLASMTKSAQVPFSSWLPAAMAAPTPVSALVHSSTLVTAGVFILIRMYEYMSKVYMFSYTLMVVSLFTMIMAGVCACTEWDMKKIIALSTLSQLGLMMLTISINMPELTYLHLITHALFKALLFICSGVLISSLFHSQDLRWMGNISCELMMVSSCMLLASLAMMGFPFLSSFYSKDVILELTLFSVSNVGFMLMFYVSIGITAFYSSRLAYNLLFMPFMSVSLFSISEGGHTMKGLFVMGTLTTISGSFFLWVLMNNYTLTIISYVVMVLPVMLVLLGVFMGFLWSYLSFDVEQHAQVMNSNMWFLKFFSTQFILSIFMNSPKSYIISSDQSWFDYIGGQGAYTMMQTTMYSLYTYTKWDSISMMTLMLVSLLMVYTL